MPNPPFSIFGAWGEEKEGGAGLQGEELLRGQVLEPKGGEGNHERHPPESRKGNHLEKLASS